MEEPPKIERIITTQGISLPDTASILKAYMSDMDRHHATADAMILPGDKDAKEGEAATALDEHGEIDEPVRKTRREREEEDLLAQMDKLVNQNSSSKMISDDIYERLKMITDSIRAEAEGGTPLESSHKLVEEEGPIVINAADAAAGSVVANNKNAIPIKSDEAILLEKQQRQRTTTPAKSVANGEQKSKRDKKKEKKAKKAAKKSAKKAKRKSREMGDGVANHDGGGHGSSKKLKVEG
mmetsp:Transcript_4966/g.12478  ORF Transcript_4966/g.12478 Transcript_4966/m.12478 type:complete len:239 (-) Transcript_4966:113-829(-)